MGTHGGWGCMDSDGSISCFVCGYCLDGLVDDGAAGRGGGGVLCPECRTPVADSVAAAREAVLLVPRLGWARWGFAAAALAEAGLAVVCVVFNLPDTWSRGVPTPMSVFASVGAWLASVLWLADRTAWVVIAGAVLPGPKKKAALGLLIPSFIAAAGVATAMVGLLIGAWSDSRDGERIVVIGLGVGAIATLFAWWSGLTGVSEIVPVLDTEWRATVWRLGGVIGIAPLFLWLIPIVLQGLHVPLPANRDVSLMFALVAAVSAVWCWCVWRGLPRARSREDGGLSQAEQTNAE